MEFQFGTNWAYYSHYVGDVFGAPLAIEGLMAFFLESTFIGLFFLGWDRLTKQAHLLTTFLMALGSNLSALWILIANGWMQNPVGAEFSSETMRMEMTSFAELLFNPVAQVKFVHTVAAGYVTASMFVLGIALLPAQGPGPGLRQALLLGGGGLRAGLDLSVILLGDESGYEVGDVQKTKLAAIEAEWETEPPPAAFTIFGFPDKDAQTTRGAIKVPYLLGLIATRSLDKPGQRAQGPDGRARAAHPQRHDRLRPTPERCAPADTSPACSGVRRPQAGPGLWAAAQALHAHGTDATPEQIRRAARDSIPKVGAMFWSFRVMVGLGFWMLVLIVVSFYYNAKRVIEHKRWLLRLFVFSMPVPWIAAELGWFVAEFGRQPWGIGEVLPTLLAVLQPDHEGPDRQPHRDRAVLHGVLIAGLYLMFKFVRLGPSSLHTGRYCP